MVGVLVGVYVYVGVFVAVSVGVGVYVAVLLGVSVLVKVRLGVYVIVGVFDAVGNGVRVLVGNPKLKSIEDAATLFKNVAPVAVNPVTNVEFNSM